MYLVYVVTEVPDAVRMDTDDTALGYLLDGPLDGYLATGSVAGWMISYGDTITPFCHSPVIASVTR
ncbi:hypothetical protein C444_19777 [Haloarcula japonica DSM 6131]|uniref:Uncharacterized protein n=1 Tax=Haloarcula japonica (strain ATCC 49778 / DSM 6131 / JCM 7785 / NBRC 101032 / NCIMB 13157 / TR-1) TaxID=1227453 RepID=M0L3U3_HALJT|nr:hypothetical protein C444_19777 [Haloarcula japonica DSM 6131]